MKEVVTILVILFALAGSLVLTANGIVLIVGKLSEVCR